MKKQIKSKIKNQLINKISEQQFFLKAKKSLGQNFLTDKSISERIVHLVEAQAGAKVLEIGPGTGVLTNLLLAKGYYVTVVEKDQRSVEGLEQSLLKSYPNHLQILQQDILRFKTENYDVCIGNIPYYITSDILFWLCENKTRFSKIILMVQDEVADRLNAKPNSKAYSRLTIKIGLNFEVKKHFRVLADSFVPKPKVNSAVISLTPTAFSFEDQKKEDLFERFTATLFSGRRKMLRRIFADAYPHFKNKTETELNEFWFKLEQQKIFPQSRPDSLSKEQYLVLFHEIQP